MDSAVQYQLRNYQQDSVNFWQANPRAAWFADMGTGKTLAALHALDVDRSKLPALVVAPLQVARFVWPTEIKRFGFDFKWNLVWGRDKIGQLMQPGDIKICNPEQLGVIEQACRDHRRVPFETVIVDESSLFKNPGSKRWKSLRALIDGVRNRLLLTGTPMPQGPADLWGQMNLLGDNNLGDYQSFLERWFSIDPFGRATPRPWAQEEIEQIIRPVVHRVDAAEVLKELPEVMTIDHWCAMDGATKRFYDEIEAGIEQITQDAYMPLRTLSGGFVYENHWSGEKRTHWKSSHKLKALEEIRAETEDSLLVVTAFRAERERLVEEHGCPFIDGGSTPKQNAERIEAWNAGQYPMMVVHPRAAGHGLNLQFGGRRVVWFSLPESDELYSQTIARLHRPGQDRTVFVHRILAKDTLDEVMVGLIRKKAFNQKALLDAMKRGAVTR